MVKTFNAYFHEIELIPSYTIDNSKEIKLITLTDIYSNINYILKILIFNTSDENKFEYKFKKGCDSIKFQDIILHIADHEKRNKFGYYGRECSLINYLGNGCEIINNNNDKLVNNILLYYYQAYFEDNKIFFFGDKEKSQIYQFFYERYTYRHNGILFKLVDLIKYYLNQNK